MMLRMAVVLLSVATMSCSSAPPLATSHSDVIVASAAAYEPTGSYVLRTIDGNAIPFRPVDPDRPAAAGPGPLVVGGSLVIEPGGQARYVLTYRGQRGRDQAIRMAPTWQRDGEQIVLVWPNGARTPVTYDGRWFTIDNIGMKLAFERER